MRLCLTSLVLLAVHNILITKFGFPRLVMGELIWLLIAPALVSAAYKRKYKEKVPFEEADRIALYYVPIMLVIGLIAVILFIPTQYDGIWDKLKDHLVFLSIMALFYFGAILIFGRWGVSAILSHDPKKKSEP